MRTGAPLADAALSRQGRCSTARDNLRVKGVRIDGAPGRRWIICQNPNEAEREQSTRDAALARLTAELDRITTMRERATRPAKGTRRRT